MRSSTWLIDTIARRFAATQVIALMVTLGLIGLFSLFGGVWSKQPLQDTGLLNEVADMVRIIEAAPAPQRDSLAAAASTALFELKWYTPHEAISDALAATHDTDIEQREHRIFDGSHRRAKEFTPQTLDRAPAALVPSQHRPDQSFILAVQLADESWLVFTTLSRTWGLPQSARLAIWTMFLALSTALVSALAARQVAKPVERLASAVERFRIDAKATALEETGPREIRHVIRVVNAMQAQIQTFVTARTTMLAAISHDLRTPLTRIRLRGEFIEDVDQQLRLFRDVDEMQTMVDGALTFFRDDAEAEKSTGLDLATLLLTIADEYADQGIEVTYTGPAHASMEGSPVALKRAFINIIDNAVKYATPPQITLNYVATALRVTISDAGPGIPEESLHAVFRPYFRLEKSRNRYTGGVGLGLTAAQATIHSHRGEISIQNLKEGGLQVSISLPTAARSRRE